MTAYALDGIAPELPEEGAYWIAPSASVIGKVRLEPGSCVHQPPGIRPAWERLASTLGNEHGAAHEVMECLGEVMWTAQRSGAAPDGQAYVECLRRRSGIGRS